MKFNPEIHHRRSVRLRNYDYSGRGLYYITICVQNRVCLFGNVVDQQMILNQFGQIAFDCWQEITTHYPDTKLHDFVIMPNHIHGIIEITANDDDVCTVGVENFQPLPVPPKRNEFQHVIPRSIGAIVRGFKIGVTKQIRTKNLLPMQTHSIWQRNMWEHIVRDFSDYARIADYINNNPANWQSDNFYC
ncbi:hypothetical protein FACS189429_2510 [Bacteroidia bacterium]|nr:hypothetical protein FACS189429_2510 [Bacteroidia bacterium]